MNDYKTPAIIAVIIFAPMLLVWNNANQHHKQVLSSIERCVESNTQSVDACFRHHKILSF